MRKITLTNQKPVVPPVVVVTAAGKEVAEEEEDDGLVVLDVCAHWAEGSIQFLAYTLFHYSLHLPVFPCVRALG